MAGKHKNHLSEYIPRKWIASLREPFLLLKEFLGPVLFFSIATLSLGCIYVFAASRLAEPVASLAEAIYLILTFTFLQPSGTFPRLPALKVFVFLMPLIGVATLARGLADFGLLLFNKRARSKEWEIAVGSNHLNIVFVHTDHHTETHPTDSRQVTSGDMIGVMGGSEQFSHLLHDNE